MNKELCLMYLRSKPEEKGYQKRLKSIWDENYEEYKNLTPRHTAEEVRNIKKKNLLSKIERQLIEIQFKVSGELVTSGEPIQSREYNTPRQHETQVEQKASENNNVPGEQNILEEHEPSEEHNEKGEFEHFPGVEEPSQLNQNQLNSSEQAHRGQVGLKEEFTTMWRNNFEKYIKLELQEREFCTKVTPPPSQDLFNIVQEIISAEIPIIEENYEMNLWTINVIYYSTAVTILEKEGKLRKTKQGQKVKEKPG